MIPVGLDPDGAMASPDDPYKVGWYSPAAKPGTMGNLLMSGHLDWMDWSTGVPTTGIFWRLRELLPGAKVIISDNLTEWTYEVRSTLKYRFDDPEGIALLQPSVEPRATIITCEGPGFDPVRRNYTYRRILIAHLIKITSLN
jgi:sortase (surface protein transpeptidase)